MLKDYIYNDYGFGRNMNSNLKLLAYAHNCKERFEQYENFRNFQFFRITKYVGRLF